MFVSHLNESRWEWHVHRANLEFHWKQINRRDLMSRESVNIKWDQHLHFKVHRGAVKCPHIPQPLYGCAEQSWDLMTPKRWTLQPALIHLPYLTASAGLDGQSQSCFHPTSTCVDVRKSDQTVLSPFPLLWSSLSVGIGDIDFWMTDTRHNVTWWALSIRNILSFLQTSEKVSCRFLPNIRIWMFHKWLTGGFGVSKSKVGPKQV